MDVETLVSFSYNTLAWRRSNSLTNPIDSLGDVSLRSKSRTFKVKSDHWKTLTSTSILMASSMALTKSPQKLKTKSSLL